MASASALALPWLGLSGAHAQDGPKDDTGSALRIYQSTALTGPLGDLGSAMYQGALAAFTHTTGRGGGSGKELHPASKIAVKTPETLIWRAVIAIELKALMAQLLVRILFLQRALGLWL